jgi:phosphotransferase system enzyme I (PtsI)
MASIFDAQLLMLDDPMLVARAADIVREHRVNAEWAVERVFQELSAVFDEIADPYLRERKGDVADLVGRLKMNLRPGMATPRDLLRELDEASVLIADELTPSLVAQIDWTKVRGFGTDAGSRTYHSAILARSLDVPAVVGLYDASRTIQPGQLVVIDGAGTGRDGRRREHQARRQHRVSGRSGGGPVRRCRRHRPVSIGVSVDGGVARRTACRLREPAEPFEQ